MALTKISGGVIQQNNFSIGVVTTTSATIGAAVTIDSSGVQVGSATTIHTTGIDLGGGTLTSHNINSTGVITATSFVGAVTGNVTGDLSGNVSGTAVTATTADITNLTGTLSGVSTNFVSAIGIQSGGTVIGAGITQLNFVGTGNTFAVNGTTVDISISGGGGSGQGFSTSVAGLHTTSSIGINTTTLNDPDLVGAGNSMQGLYVSNGMIIFDNTLTGNHYIGTNYSGLIAGPANVTGVLTIDGEYVVV